MPLVGDKGDAYRCTLSLLVSPNSLFLQLLPRIRRLSHNARPDAAEQTIRQIRQTQALGIAITPLLSHWSCIVSEFLFYGPNTAEMRLQLLSIKLT
jgi:hypothetical protein